MTSDVIRLRLPVLYCVSCRSQVLTTDGLGRWTCPTFRVEPIGPAGWSLLCVHCAKRRLDPGVLTPVHPDMARWVPGSDPALSEIECFDFLMDLGAVQVAETDGRLDTTPSGGLW